MDQSKVETFILTNREYFLKDDLPMIRHRMLTADENKWSALSTITFKDPQTALMLSIFGGPIGVDRFYIGDYLLGVFKTITCGGILIWAFIDQFLIRKATKENNKENLFNILNM